MAFTWLKRVATSNWTDTCDVTFFGATTSRKGTPPKTQKSTWLYKSDAAGAIRVPFLALEKTPDSYKNLQLPRLALYFETDDSQCY